jgi:nuclear pore complex protein Nup155
VYDLGEDGQSAKRIASVSLSTTVSQAMRLIKTSNSKLFQPLVHIAAVESSESTRVNVVAISQAGEYWIQMLVISIRLA